MVASRGYPVVRSRTPRFTIKPHTIRDLSITPSVAVSNKVSVSVIIPTLNESRRVGRAIKSAWDALADQVIVADGGSTDSTVSAVEEAGATLVQCQQGRAVQQNSAAALATGDVVLFLHADNWLSKEALAEVRSEMMNRSQIAGAFRQRIDASGVAYRCLERGNGWRVRFLGQPYGDQGIFVSRELFEHVGGFPEVPLMEELSLMRRIREHFRPILLEGPIYVDARRWQTHGIVRQTIRNWSLVVRYFCGVSPERLAGDYVNHQEPSPNSLVEIQRNVENRPCR